MAENESRPLESSVLDWFQKQGYSLEMRVARIFHEAGFAVSQFESYVDPESGSLREIDVVASVTHEVAGIAASFALLIECKHCPKPWVLLTSPRRSASYYCFSRILQGNFDVHEWREYSTFQARVLARMLASLGRTEAATMDFFCLPQRPGYAIVEAFKERERAKDNAYTAVMQAHSCATAHDRRSQMIFEDALEHCGQRLHETGGTSTGLQLFCSVGFPLVVAEGQIFECHLDAGGDVALSETAMGTVLVSSKEGADPWKAMAYDSVVRVVTQDSVASLAAQAKKALDALLSQEEALLEIWEYESSKMSHEEEADEIPF